MFGPKFKEWDVAESIAPEDVTAQAPIGYEERFDDTTVVDVKQHVRLRVFRKERIMRRLSYAAVVLLGALMIPVLAWLAWTVLGQGVPLPEWVVIAAFVALAVGVTIVIRMATSGR